MIYLVDQDACHAIRTIITDPRVVSFFKADGSEVHIIDLATPSRIDYLNQIADWVNLVCKINSELLIALFFPRKRRPNTVKTIFVFLNT